jgi:hypothetical protein
MLIDDDIEIYENEAFYFEEKYKQLSSKSLEINYVFRTKADCIKAVNYKAICDQVNLITRQLPVIIYFDK